MIKMSDIKGFFMKQITIQDCLQAYGGFLPALAALIAVIAAPIIIHDNIKKYNSIGHQLGEAAWEHYHPYDPNQ